MPLNQEFSIFHSQKFKWKNFNYPKSQVVSPTRIPNLNSQETIKKKDSSPFNSDNIGLNFNQKVISKKFPEIPSTIIDSELSQGAFERESPANSSKN